MKCIIIDDDPFQRHLLSQYINQVDHLELIGEFDSASKAIQFLSGHEPDLIFLDIEMPGMSGVEFLEQFKPKANIILISSKEEYAINGYTFEVQDYLLKPISFARFTRSVNRIVTRTMHESSSPEAANYLFIKDKGIYQKILISDIQYIQSSSEYVTIHSKNKRVMLYSSMDGILKKLPANFIRVHRSFIVNLNAIERVNGNTVEIVNQSINVSKTYHDELMGALGLKVHK
jgi:DNA-binding LytR/AlgR family response regulator